MEALLWVLAAVVALAVVGGLIMFAVVARFLIGEWRAIRRVRQEAERRPKNIPAW
mgnify:CR=1 FL=1